MDATALLGAAAWTEQAVFLSSDYRFGLGGGGDAGLLATGFCDLSTRTFGESGIGAGAFAMATSLAWVVVKWRVRLPSVVANSSRCMGCPI